MTNKVRVRVLLGVYRDDLDLLEHPPTPVVAGAMDATLWEVLDVEESDAMFDKMKEAYDPSGADYEWREVWVDLPADALKSLFAVTEVEGEVVDDD